MGRDLIAGRVRFVLVIGLHEGLPVRVPRAG
jgi:hypothetical protein